MPKGHLPPPELQTHEFFDPRFGSNLCLVCFLHCSRVFGTFLSCDSAPRRPGSPIHTPLRFCSGDRPLKLTWWYQVGREFSLPGFTLVTPGLSWFLPLFLLDSWTRRRCSDPAARARYRIKWAHSEKFLAHPGFFRTSSLLSRHFWWPHMSRDIKNFVLSCPVCAQNKPSNQRPAGLLQPLPVPERPWSHIALDFVTGLPSSNGMTTILTIINRFSKSCHLIPLRKLPSALQMAQLLVKHVFRLHGIPLDILSDRGPQFTSRVWKEFASALGARYTLTSGYHPQTNGQTERMNQELESTLRCLTSTNPSDWSQYLPWIEYAHNSHVSTATGISPFEASLGYQPPLFPSEEKQIAVPSVHHHIHRCRQFWTLTNQALLRTAEQNRRFADRRRTPPGSGSPPEIYLPAPPVVNWLPVTQVPMRSSQ
uniref:Gypsy retrotransposon integrase-like protein 1 n=1 Tax=Fundulus heteroclitus TaxID=8078 RepID=A0A3Q2NTH6_FUNHE